MCVGKRKVRFIDAPEGVKGEDWDVLQSVDGLVKSASGRYLKPN